MNPKEAIKFYRAAFLDLFKKSAEIPPVDRSKRELTTGDPVPEDDSHTELLPSGQQKGYVVLSEEERRKGFVRPVRCSYKHVGVRPRHATRELTAEEKKQYADYHYVLKEINPDGNSGRYWTEKQLHSGCGTVTTMGRALAETYARDPEFYGGTFCCGCGTHLPLEEFVWCDNPDEVVGS
jgi:hypothetical protein